MKKLFPFVCLIFFCFGCAPAPASATPTAGPCCVVKSSGTVFAEWTAAAAASPTPSPLPPASPTPNPLLPAECLQLDERLNLELSGWMKNTVPWTKSVSCYHFTLSQDNQHLAYVHATYNDSPEVAALVEARCSNTKKSTLEACRAGIGLVETVKVLDSRTGEIRSLQTVSPRLVSLLFVKLEWLATGELHYKLGNTEGPSFNLIYDPATELVSAITPTPFPTPVSPLAVRVKEQVYGADIAWSPDGKTLAVASCYAGCRLELLNPIDLSLLWSVELPGNLSLLNRAVNPGVSTLRFSPDGESLAVSWASTFTYYEPEIWLFNADDGTVLWQAKIDVNEPALHFLFRDFKFSPNGENITVLVEPVGDAPEEIWFLDVRDGKNLRQWKVRQAKSPSQKPTTREEQWELKQSLTFFYSPSGEQLVTTGETLTLWNVSSGGRRWELDAGKFPAQSGGCQVETFDRAMFSQNQTYLFARGTGKDSLGDFPCNALLALNLKTQKVVVLQAEPDPDSILPHMSALHFDESTSALLVHQQYLGLRRWNVETQEVTAVEQPGDFVFSNDLAQFAPMAQNGDFYFDEVLEFAALPNQTWLALSVEEAGSGSGYEDFYLYDLSTGAWLDLFPSTYSSDWNEYSMQSPSLSPDGRWLAAVNGNGKLRFWNMVGLRSVNTAVQPNATPEPSATPAFSCPLAPSPRVKVGDMARITFTTGQRTRLRSAPEAGDNVVAMLAEGTEFKIIDGPRCYLRPGTNQAYVYWKIFVTSNSQAGWLAEGDADSYFIEPLSN